MKKNENSLKLTVDNAEPYKFDTSKYIILTSGVKRNIETGKLERYEKNSAIKQKTSEK